MFRIRRAQKKVLFPVLGDQIVKIEKPCTQDISWWQDVSVGSGLDFRSVLIFPNSDLFLRVNYLNVEKIH